MDKYLIVGVDPGTTTGVALLDLKGRLVGLKSSKDMGLSGIIEFIVSNGRPSLVACDVSPPPSMVSKLSSTLGVLTYVPDESLPVSEKIALARGFDAGDAHQRDSLAAALNAYSKFRNKFVKIESLGLGDDVKHLVLQGNSIESAVRMLSKPAVEEPEAVKPEPAEARALSEDEKRIRSLERRVKALSEELGAKDAQIVGLMEKIAALKSRQHVEPAVRHEPSERVIGGLESKISSLKREVVVGKAVRRTLVDAVKGDVIFVGVYPEVVNGYTLARNRVDERGLRAGDFKAVFTDVQSNARLFKALGVPVYDTKMLKELDGLWFAEVGRMREVEGRVSIEDIVSEYRGSRSL